MLTAEEVRRCLAEGKKESDVMPHKLEAAALATTRFNYFYRSQKSMRIFLCATPWQL